MNDSTTIDSPPSTSSFPRRNTQTIVTFDSNGLHEFTATDFTIDEVAYYCYTHEPASYANPQAYGTRFTTDERRKSAQQWLPDVCYNCENATCTRHKPASTKTITFVRQTETYCERITQKVNYLECRHRIQRDLYNARKHQPRPDDNCAYCLNAYDLAPENDANKLGTAHHDCETCDHATDELALPKPVTRQQLVPTYYATPATREIHDERARKHRQPQQTVSLERLTA